jgi:hypothetical protein
MADEPEIGKWPSLIPEIYYDLISRVPPGVLLFLALLVAGSRLSLGQIQSVSFGAATILLLLLVLAGYTLGILMTPLADIFHRTYKRSVWRETISKQDFGPLVQLIDSNFNLCLPKNEKNELDVDKIERRHYDLLDRVMHDYLKGIDPQAKLILPKMRAEARLCDHLFVALLCVGRIMAYCLWVKHENLLIQQGTVILAVIGLIASRAAARYRTEHLIHRQFSFMRLATDQKPLKAYRAT